MGIAGFVEASTALSERLRDSGTRALSQKAAVSAATSRLTNLQAVANEPAVRGHEELAGVEPAKTSSAVLNILKSVIAAPGLLTDLEQAIGAATFGKIPFPGFPALRMFDVAVGIMHGHAHPPSQMGPAPPIPMAGIGPLLPIPFLSGADSVYTTGRSAARCDDMGFAVAAWCGGFFPIFEVKTGSATVWIEGSRAARNGIDHTNHCLLEAHPEKSKDPPVGSQRGATITGSIDVLIGGVPLPSFAGIILGKAFSAAFKKLAPAFGKISAVAKKIPGFSRFLGRPGRAIGRGIAKGAKALGKGANAVGRGMVSPGTSLGRLADNLPFIGKHRINRYLDDVLGPGTTVKGSNSFKRAIAGDVRTHAMTPEGRKLLGELRADGPPVVIKDPRTNADVAAAYRKDGAHASFYEASKIRTRPAVDPANPTAGVHPKTGAPLDFAGNGPGGPVDVVYDPRDPVPGGGKTPSDIVGFHEFSHASRARRGEINLNRSVDDSFNADFPNLEEYNVVERTNVQRAQRNAALGSDLSERGDYFSELE